MPRKCSICTHPDRNKIDLALTLRSDSIDQISKQYSVTTSSLNRHVRSGHLSKKIAKAVDVQEVAQADNLLSQINSLKDRALDILEKAEGDKAHPPDLRTACTAIREVRGILELLAKVTGELNDGPQINILMNPEWVEIRTVILHTLESYPEARAQLVDALAAVEVPKS